MKLTMNNLKISFAALLFTSLPLSAQTNPPVPTGVVGFQTVTLPANTVTAIGVNFLNKNILIAPVDQVSTNSISLSQVTNISSLLNANTPYYLEIRSGVNEGTRLEINTADSIADNTKFIINVASTRNTEDLALISSSLPGASVALRKHVTLSDLTPNISGLTSGSSGTGDEILVFDSTTSSWVTYLRRTSTTWRDAFNTTVDPVVAPGEGILIRKRATPGSITTIGDVRGNNFHLNTKSGYQFVTLGFPSDNSFSGIGALSGNWKFGASGVGDEALILKSDGSGYNTYLYRTSTSWRDAFNATVNTNQILSGGGAVFFKKSLAEDITLPKPSGL